MKYIGIRGHKGAGKTLISYVLGNTIEYIIQNNSNPNRPTFNKWVDEIIDNENIINENALTHVYFDSFGDVVKTFVSLLIGCDMSKLQHDYCKDHILINMRTFKWEEYETIPDKLPMVTPDKLFRAFSKCGGNPAPLPDVYMSLRDFIMYFGHNVMKGFLGIDVWIKSMQQNVIFENIFDDKSYKIYRDVKMSSEITYIKNEKQGVIVKVVRPGVTEKSKVDNLTNDRRYDYLIRVKSDVHDIYDEVIGICNDIINKNYGKDKEN